MSNERQLGWAIDAWAASHRDELVRDVMELVRIPSVTGTAECAQAADKLLEMAQRYQFCTERDGDWSVSILHHGLKNTRELGILGHLDVVPAGAGWRYAPYEPIEKAGWIIGRGSSDNKGPVVMSLYVLRCLREMGIELNSTVRLIAGCREETDMQDVKHYLQIHQPPAYTLNCDGAWAGCIGEKGILEADLLLPLATDKLISFDGGTASNTVPDQACAVLKANDSDDLSALKALHSGLKIEVKESRAILRVSGKAAHCCMPARGDNAIIRLLHLLCDSGLVKELEHLKLCFPDCYGTGLRINHEDAVSGKTTCTATTAHLESGVLRVHINARTAVTQRFEWLMNTLQKRLDKLGIGLENVHWSPPRLDSPDQPQVKLLLETCQEFLDPKAKPYVMGGGTHSRYFPHSLPYGPEVLDPRVKRSFGRAHEADEAVCIDDLLRAIKVYVIALKRLDEQLENS